MPANKNKYTPTEEDRTRIQKLAGLGMRQKDICYIMGISERTLRRHHKEDCEYGKSFVNSKIAERAYTLAMEGDKTMLIFWMKCQMGWRDQGHTVEEEQEEQQTRYVNAPPEAKDYDQWMESIGKN